MALLTPSLRRKRERVGSMVRGCKNQTYRKKGEGMKIKVELVREAEQKNDEKEMGKMFGWGLTPSPYNQADGRIKERQRGQLPVGPAATINCPQDSLMEAATSGGWHFNS